MSEVRSTRFRDRMMTYLELTKPRLMWLVLLALAGMGLAVATGAELDGVTVVATPEAGSSRSEHRGRSITCTSAIATARCDGPLIDRNRSSRRSTRDGLRCRARHRLNGGAGGVCERSHTAALTVAAIVYYAYVYTVLLKPTTRWNTVIGAAPSAARADRVRRRDRDRRSPGGSPRARGLLLDPGTSSILPSPTARTTRGPSIPCYRSSPVCGPHASVFSPGSGSR